MKIACVIPARLQSTRFPKKMLSYLGNKPLLQWVWDSALATGYFDQVLIAVDAQETADLIEGFGGRWVMTSSDHCCGTERIVEILEKGWIDADVVVNWQGDEPFIQKSMIRDLLQSVEDGSTDIWTLKKRIDNLEQIQSLHIAKVVADVNEHALFFSRSPIPCYRDARPNEEKIYYKHVGIYAYTRKALQKIATLSPCEAEEAEQLEQLRFLYHGLKIKVHETSSDVQGIDLPEHLALAERLIELI